jgi:hypothetical protein
MKPNPIKHCRVCGKPIVRMRKVFTWNGYYLDWSRAKVCGQVCYQREYRARKKYKRLRTLFGD